jgi:hypothetical protein
MTTKQAPPGQRKKPPVRYRHREHFGYVGIVESNTEFEIEPNTWPNTGTESRSAAFWQRRVGERQRQLTFPKQRCLGVARQPMIAP